MTRSTNPAGRPLAQLVGSRLSIGFRRDENLRNPRSYWELLRQTRSQRVTKPLAEPETAGSTAGRVERQTENLAFRTSRQEMSSSRVLQRPTDDLPAVPLAGVVTHPQPGAGSLRLAPTGSPTLSRCPRRQCALRRRRLRDALGRLLSRCRRRDRELNMPCYFMVLDLLGFSNLVSNLQPNELHQRVENWVGLVERLMNDNRVTDIQLISDTVFVKEQDSSEGLSRLLGFARALLEHGIQQSCPIRGALTHGEVHWGRLTYGKPVVEAHSLELSQDWIGISCAARLPRLEGLWSWDRVVVYPVPRKAGPILLAPAVVWNIPASQDLVAKTISNGLYGPGEIIPWEWQSKIHNTLLFSKYLHRGATSGADPQRFTYATPTHFLDELQ